MEPPRGPISTLTIEPPRGPISTHNVEPPRGPISSRTLDDPSHSIFTLQLVVKYLDSLVVYLHHPPTFQRFNILLQLPPAGLVPQQQVGGLQDHSDQGGRGPGLSSV